MKLIVQIPCLNEARDIADVIQAVPRAIEGIDVAVGDVIVSGDRARGVEEQSEHAAHMIGSEIDPVRSRAR